MCLDDPRHHLQLSFLIQHYPFPLPDHPQMSSLDHVRGALDSADSSLTDAAQQRGDTEFPLAVHQAQ